MHSLDETESIRGIEAGFPDSALFHQGYAKYFFIKVWKTPQKAD